MASQIRKKRKVTDETLHSFIDGDMYECLWCDRIKSNIEGRLYCDQCLKQSVGQCKSCGIHSPFQYMFKATGMCIACDIKRRLKQAKKNNPEDKKRRKDERIKKNGPSMGDIVKQLRSENMQLTRDIIDLSKENFQLKQNKVLRGEGETVEKQVYSLDEAADMLEAAMKEVY